MRGAQMTEIRGIAYNGGVVGYSILCGETSGGVLLQFTTSLGEDCKADFSVHWPPI